MLPDRKWELAYTTDDGPLAESFYYILGRQSLRLAQDRVRLRGRLDDGRRWPENDHGAAVPVRDRIDGRVGYRNGGG